MPEGEYIQMLDGGSIYICTSYQEGGPLPAMDAMARGCVVITTPVGQMMEIIQDGYNGYICSTKEQFLEKIAYLANNPEQLHTMRLASSDTLQQKRSRDIISKKVANFLFTLSQYFYENISKV